jgi:acyl-CoA thioester hydrolase
MLKHQTKIRIRYGETDQMGYVYYGNYAQFLEIGRVETLRSLGFSYKSLEDTGIMLPVIDLQIRYLKPAFYDDLITVHTRIVDTPTMKIKFAYEIFNEKNDLLTTASTTLVFVKKETMLPTHPPADFIKKIEELKNKN